MMALSGWFDGIFYWAGTGLFHATALAALTWLLTATVLRRSRPAISAALWTVVLLKFLLPPILPGAFALSSWLPGLHWGTTTGSAAMAMIDESVLTTSAVAEPAGLSLTAASLIWKDLIGWAGVWLPPLYFLGVAWIAAAAACRWLRMRRTILALPRAEEGLDRLVSSLASRLGIARRIETLTTSNSATPYVFGLWRPRLVLPSELTGRIDSGVLEALVVHELAHIRRGDLVVRWFQNVARVLLFFWPPVWWVCRRIERASEMACDQWAVAFSRIQPHLYAKSLLDVAKNVSASQSGLRQLAFADRGRWMEERFEMILKKTHGYSPRISWLGLLFLALWAGFAWAGGAEPQQEAEKKRSVTVHQIGEEGEQRHHVMLSAEGEGLHLEYFGFLVKHHPEADLDGDGNLSKEELQAFSKQLREKELQLLLERHPEADLDGDGSLSREEMNELQARRSEESRMRLLELHPEADLDADGVLSPDELIDLKKTVHEHMKMLAILELTGKDDSKFRFRMSSPEHLAEIDGDGDGLISNEEMKKFGESKEAYFYRRHHEGEAEGHDFTIRRKISFQLKSDDGEITDLTLEPGAVWVGDSLPHLNESPEMRRARLLKEHPEADSDGDGTINDEEARAFAAKMQREAKSLQKAKKKDH